MCKMSQIVPMFTLFFRWSSAQHFPHDQFHSFNHCLFTKRVTKSSYHWLHFPESFHFYTRASLVSTSLCGCFFLKTPKTPLINTAKPVKCRIHVHSAGVEADIIVHSRRLVRNVHCEWLKIAVRFLNATNRISPFWHTLKREISRCGPRERNVAQCSAIERGFPTMPYKRSRLEVIDKSLTTFKLKPKWKLLCVPYAFLSLRAQRVIAAYVRLRL